MMKEYWNKLDGRTSPCSNRWMAASTQMQAIVRLSMACVLFRARAALLTGGGHEVAGAYLGCNTTHVVCEPETASHWLSMGALGHSPARRVLMRAFVITPNALDFSCSG